MDAGAEIDRHGRAGGRVVGHVEAAATDQRVGADSARERIGSCPAVEDVVVAVARQHVGLVRARQVGDLQQHVTAGVAAEGQAAAQIDRHALVRRTVIGRVEVAAADQRVGRAGTREGIGARATVDHVRVEVAHQAVGAA